MILDLTKHIEHIIDIANKEILINNITILTGGNGKGKSLIRKIVSNGIAEQLGKENGKGLVSATSQEARCGSNPEWGALSGALNDVGWTPTSTETIHNIKTLINERFSDRFIVIDEPEIGMGEETVAGLVKYLNKTLSKHKNLGTLIITHNRYIVEHLKIDKFINIEGMTREEWLNRKIVPLDLDDLQETSDKLFRAIQDRINENEKKGK